MTAPAASSSPSSQPPSSATGPAKERSAAAGFVQGFDGLRAIAALLVVVVHVAGDSGFTYRSSLGEYTSRGEIGVSVFFLISGFLLYRPFVAAAFSGRPGPGVRSYLLRRALRIVPLYWVALFATYAFAGWASVHGVSGLLENMFFLQVYSTDWVFHGITQAWSLCIEVTFYLALPLWAVLLRRADRSRAGGAPAPGVVLRRELTALAALYVASLLFRIWVVADPHGPTLTARSWLPSWADHFALGMGLAVVAAYVRETGVTPRVLRWLSRPGGDLLSWVGAAVIFWVVSSSVGLETAPLYVGHWYNDLAKQVLYGFFGLFMLLPAVFGPPRVGPVRWFLSSRVMALIGLVSYGVYLWHQLVIRELQRWISSWQELHTPVLQLLLATLAITLVVSAITYVLVERPGIAVGHRWLLRRRERAAETGR